MRLSWFLVFLLFLSFASVAQNQNIKVAETVTVDGKTYLLHEVKPGETLFSICKKYAVEQKELVGANPQLIFGLKEGDNLKIPYQQDQAARTENTTPDPDGNQFSYHVVKKGETIYSISKEFNVPVRSIYKYNPESEDEVLENEIIRIPKFKVSDESDGLVREDADFYYHKIQPKENLYSLSRKYDTGVADIIKYNPGVSDRFEIGAILRIPKFQEETPQLDVQETGEYFYYTVETGDTFYSFQRRFGVSREMLLALNPELEDGLKAGLSIKIPSTRIPKVEVVPVDPNEFIDHVVQRGETLYGISKQYDVKIMDIKALNPELKTRGLIAGETIYIAKKEVVRDTIAPVKELTPEIVQEVKPDTEREEPKLIIPEVVFKYEEETQPECKKDYSVSNEDTFHIAMFMPFFYDQNDTFNLERISDEEWHQLDSLKSIDSLVLAEHFRIEFDSLSMEPDTILVDSLKVKEVRSLFGPSRPAVSLYEGVLIALDSMQKAGTQISLSLYDTQGSVAVVDSILSQPEFMRNDLIVGPIDTTLQKSVAYFSAKNEMPMVSPFAACETILDNNPYYFQVSPSKSYMLDKTAEYIADEYYDKNFVVLTYDNYAVQPEFKMVEKVREKFFSRKILNNNNDILFNLVDFSGTDGYWQVKKTLKKDVENVIFIPATYNKSIREAMLSRAINSLNVLADEYSITLIGVFDYPAFRSIKTEYYHKLKMHYLSPNYIDYNRPAVNSFIKKFRQNFNAEPDILSYRGYDIMTYFIGAYNTFGKNFNECISSYENRSLQSDFNFQKVQQFGGFMNHSLYIIDYTPDYRVKVISEVTEGRVLKNEP